MQGFNAVGMNALGMAGATVSLMAAACLQANACSVAAVSASSTASAVNLTAAGCIQANQCGPVAAGITPAAQAVNLTASSCNQNALSSSGQVTVEAQSPYSRAPAGAGYYGQDAVAPHTLRLVGEPAAAVPLAAALTAARTSAGAGMDDEVQTAAVAFTEEAEGITQRAFVQQTWRATWTEFPPALKLPRPPLIAVAHVKFYDESGVQRVLDPQDYEVDAESEPACIVPAPGRAWPKTGARIHAVEVQYTCGYGASPDSVPAAIQRYVLGMVENSYYPNPNVEYLRRLLDRYWVPG